MKRIATVFVLICLCLASGISSSPDTRQVSPQPQPAAGDNPFFKPYGTPFNVPPFGLIKNEHFLPAIEEGIRREQAEVDAIVNNPAPPAFETTIAALDHTGIFLSDVNAVFGALQGANTNKELQALARKTAPLLAAHRDNIGLNEKLFRRVKAVYDQRHSLKLDREELFLLENTYRDFVRGGALLDEKEKTRLRELNQEMSLLTVKFGENVLAETNDFKLVIEDRTDLAGLPPSVVAMAAETAKQAGLEGKWVFTIQVPSMIPFLQYSEKRELRERLHRAYFMKGDRDNASDNKEILKKIATLRRERARLLGYDSHAAFVLENNMAKTPDRVDAFLKQLWEPTLVKAKEEAADLQAMINRQGGGFKLASWDWWLYTEKLRQEKYALDDTGLRPYFKLDNVRQGIFALCEKLYGLKFVELPDLPRYHPDVQAFEVREADGRHTGVLYMDFHPRASKRGGAWSGGFRRAYYEQGQRVPPVANIVCNFTRPTADTPSLLSTDEVETFFHEFGHALATLFSQARYRSRTVARDSVELPSQIMEHWAFEPELLAVYAKHYKTGEVIPAALVEKLEKSSLFNQGFITGEYLAASILDMAWHTLPNPAEVDVRQFENKVMAAIGLIPEIVPRYRSPYFNHIFSGGYSAGYYAYIWSEVLDCDAYEAFKEKGIFDRATALSFRKNILEPFGTEDPMAQYVRFRGAEPQIEPLLRNRGLEAKK
ncbi:MAG: M3 family metallopeptidase [Candidatus Aminicenantes bacterium]|nr:M3 family metallopeptidase [Candidatus Aminicenantes bacterium]